MKVIPQTLYGTAAEWTAANQVLAEGEIGVETDTGKIKIGDGLTVWNSLTYSNLTPAELGTAASEDVTTSATDTTAGRLLKVGDFGLGRAGNAIVLSDLNSTSVAAGFYIVTTDTTNIAQRPSGASAFAYVLVERYDSVRIKQTYSTIDNRTCFRTSNGLDTWQPWRELYHTGNTPIQPNATNLILDSGANLGIGTTTPDVPLDVAASTAIVQIDSSEATAGAAVIRHKASNRTWVSGVNATDPTGAYTLFDVTSGTERLRVDSSGKLLSPNGSAFVGTVSNSGNGSIIERGSNANGEYVKFADGTMICRSVTGFTALSSPYIWTFPSQFSGGLIAFLSTERSDAINLQQFNVVTSSTTAKYYLSNTTSQFIYRFAAIGRWF